MKRRFTRNKLIILSVALLVIAGTVYIVRAHHNKPAISSQMLSQSTFPLYYPGATYHFKLDRKTLVYDPKVNLLNFHIESPGGILNITQQAKPENYFKQGVDLQLKDLKPEIFETRLGQVTLVKDKHFDGDTTVLATDKTLIFVTSDKRLGQSQWQDFYNSLEIVRRQ